MTPSFIFCTPETELFLKAISNAGFIVSGSNEYGPDDDGGVAQSIQGSLGEAAVFISITFNASDFTGYYRVVRKENNVLFPKWE